MRSMRSRGRQRYIFHFAFCITAVLVVATVGAGRALAQQPAASNPAPTAQQAAPSQQAAPANLDEYMKLARTGIQQDKSKIIGAALELDATQSAAFWPVYKKYEAELAAIGYATVEESARAIIAERLARGASRRPDPPAFAREILRRDIEKYRGQRHTSDWVFFDRGVLDALGMLQDVAPLPARELEAMLSTFIFHPTVFILPPWEAIYVNDTERDQSFAEAVNVHTRIVQWYGACGYLLCEVPPLPVAQRAEHVLRTLAEFGASE